MRDVARFWLPPIGVMVVIYALSAQPDIPHPPGPWMDGVVDKIAHAAGYGLLAWLFLRALEQRFTRSVALEALCVIIAVAYGVTDEFHQSFVPGRNPSLADLAADATGAIGAMALSGWIQRRRGLPGRSSAAR